MEPIRYRRLLPPGPEIDAGAHLGELGPARADRPYVIANFVASVDGRATAGAHSRRLSGQADRALFYALRERADAVLIGPNTLAAEHYKRMLPQQERRDRRRAADRAVEPLAVTVSRSGEIPRDIPLFDETPDQVLVFEGDGVPLDAVLSTLRRDHDVELLLCEGGPTLFGALLGAQLVDELFLTLAPYLAGGASGPGIVAGALPGLTGARLTGASEHDGALFLRYRLGTGET